MLAGILFQIIFSRALLCLRPVQSVLDTGPVSGEGRLSAWLGIPLIFGADDLSQECFEIGSQKVIDMLHLRTFLNGFSLHKTSSNKQEAQLILKTKSQDKNSKPLFSKL